MTFKTDEELKALEGLKIIRAETVDYPLTDGLILTCTRPEGQRVTVEIEARAPWEIAETETAPFITVEMKMAKSIESRDVALCDRTTGLLNDFVNCLKNADLKKSTRISFLEKFEAMLTAVKADAFADGIETACFERETGR